MAGKTCDDPKIDIPVWIIIIFIIAGVILLIDGGYTYHRQHPKEKNYKVSNCLVLTVGYRNHTCKGHRTNFTCYSATWGVRHDKIQPINGTVQSEKKYSSLNETMSIIAEYKVNIGTIDANRSLFSYFDAII